MAVYIKTWYKYLLGTNVAELLLETWQLEKIIRLSGHQAISYTPSSSLAKQLSVTLRGRRTVATIRGHVCRVRGSLPSDLAQRWRCAL